MSVPFDRYTHSHMLLRYLNEEVKILLRENVEAEMLQRFPDLEKEQVVKPRDTRTDE